MGRLDTAVAAGVELRGAGWLCVGLGGGLFGFGLALSGMVRPEVVLDFLMFRDFGLLLVLGGAALTAMLAFRLAPRLLRQPLLGGWFHLHPARIDRRSIVGAALFGIGWGISGVCPAPAVAGLGAGDWRLLWSAAGMFLGAWIQGRWFARGA